MTCRARWATTSTSGGTSADALDLAERYETTFGRGRLEGLIRAAVPDAAWEHGRAHERLLELPWTDVLTTNYDTLLEWASRAVTGTSYEPVLTPADVARTRSPRTVKLHGTMPSHTPFVIMASDYRTYHARFAPFVNLARQVLRENDVLRCLVRRPRPARAGPVLGLRKPVGSTSRGNGASANRVGGQVGAHRDRDVRPG